MDMKPLARLYGLSILGVALLAPFGTTSLAQDRGEEQRREQQRGENTRRYQDTRHNDEHEWNDHENQAYRMWVQQNHRKYNDFDRLRARDQQNYWDWRHNHSDAQLKIEIH
jgi:hypothetical protein